MPYDADMLDVAAQILARPHGQRGRIVGARIRRSISTSYYALFHFVLNEVAMRHADLRNRQNLMARTMSHTGIKLAMDRIKGKHVEKVVEPLFHGFGLTQGPVPVPKFAQDLARNFIEAHNKRQDADYNLNEPLSETDARTLLERVRSAIAAWRGAKSASDRDFKNVACLLVLLKGQLR